MKPEITLIYDANCPNASEARASLREALDRLGLEPEWVEYDRATLGRQETFLRYGSPTILVDGADVAGETPTAAAACCRIYSDVRRLRGAPRVGAIVDAIMRSRATAREAARGR